MRRQCEQWSEKEPEERSLPKRKLEPDDFSPDPHDDEDDFQKRDERAGWKRRKSRRSGADRRTSTDRVSVNASVPRSEPFGLRTDPKDCEKVGELAPLEYLYLARMKRPIILCTSNTVARAGTK